MAELSETFGNVYDYKTLQALTPYIGYPTARMLFLMGYKDLFAIAEARPTNIRYLPHVGPERFSKIVECLNSVGLDFDYSDAGPKSLMDNFGINSP
ncbi:hypothetical protein C7435_2729 [Maricaulis maris]|uniref:RNA polymerase alpha subunit C-terminal domain-containing protein n=1 Tax=Maricaulis maris TaxID=74318 RepID=A0A495D261_9PROT|nr:hypothetical protein C7435_2729 [Maricaulis maris]